MAKDSPKTTAGELQKIVESWGQKPKKNCQTAPTSPHVMDTTRLELQMGLASMVR